jgi:hypothetical protein
MYVLISVQSDACVLSVVTGCSGSQGFFDCAVAGMRDSYMGADDVCRFAVNLFNAVDEK